MDGAAPGAAPDEVTIGERVGQLAARHPDAPAVIAVAPETRPTVLTWEKLETGTNVAARVLADRGVSESSVVVVSLPTGLDHVLATVAAWKLGAVVLPLDPAAPERETAALLDAAGAALVVGRGPGALDPKDLRSGEVSAAPLSRLGTPRSAHATGGSTGRPRIVLRSKPWVYPTRDIPSKEDRSLGLDVGQVQLTMLPLHHTGFTKLHHGLVLDHTVVLLQRFVPALVPELIERYRVNYLAIVPTMMRWILDVPGLSDYDLSSVTTVHHGAAACPEWVKRAWLELLGPETVYEGYGSQERIGAVWIRGDDWLQHPGSVGRPTGCEVRILAADGSWAGPGEVGEVFLRGPVTRQPSYIGSGEPLPERDGFLSLGDAGYLDRQGYLYLVGRRSEMINVGGTNVYPAEVEHVLASHPEVLDAAVVGREHAHLGQSVHALIVPVDPERPPSSGELDEHCRSQLSLPKVPLSYEFVSSIPRTAADKIRRATLTTT